MAFKLADLFVEFRAKGLVALRASMQALRGSLKLVVASLHRVAAFTWRWAKIGLVAATAALAAGVYQAAKFEEQLANVSTMLVGDAMKWLPAYARSLKRLSMQFGEATETLSRGLYDILSASVAPAKAIGVLTTAVKAAKAGMTSTAVSADAITTVLNAYGLRASKAGKVSDQLFATVLRGKLTFEQLASSIGKAAATSAIAGLSLEELLAAVSTITRAGINAQQAMTAVVGVLRSFLKPASETKKISKELGIEWNTATLEALGLTGVLKLLDKESAATLAALFPNIRGLKGVAAAAKDAKGHAKDLALQYRSAGMTARAFAKIQATLGYQLGQLRQSVNAVFREVGEYFLPEIKAAVRWLTRFAQTAAVRVPQALEKLRSFLVPLGVAFKGLWNSLFPAGSEGKMWDAVTKGAETLATFLRDKLVVAIAHVAAAIQGMGTTFKQQMLTMRIELLEWRTALKAAGKVPGAVGGAFGSAVGAVAKGAKHPYPLYGIVKGLLGLGPGKPGKGPQSELSRMYGDLSQLKSQLATLRKKEGKPPKTAAQLLKDWGIESGKIIGDRFVERVKGQAKTLWADLKLDTKILGGILGGYGQNLWDVITAGKKVGGAAEPEKAGKGKYGDFMGIGEIWKTIQTGIMKADPKLVEMKKHTGQFDEMITLLDRGQAPVIVS